MKVTKSIHWRLLLWIAFFLTVILAGLVFAAGEIHYLNRLSRLDEELGHRMSGLNEALFSPQKNGLGRPPQGRPPSGPMNMDGTPPNDSSVPPEPPPGGFSGPPPHSQNNSGSTPSIESRPPRNPVLEASRLSTAIGAFNSSDPNDFYFVIWRAGSSSPVKTSANAAASVPRPVFSKNDAESHIRTRGGYRELFHSTPGGECLLVGRTLGPELSEVRRFVSLLGAGSIAVMVLSLGGVWLIISRALRPVGKIGAAARRIASGNLSERINTDETDSELGQLAGVLNSTFSRLETAFAQQKQFTANAAHELRTPLAVMISEAQTSLARERNAAEYRDALSVCLDTAQQMRRLTESLLELSRFDAGQEKLNRQNVDLSLLVEEAVKFVIPIAAPQRVQMICHLSSADISGDSERLGQVVRNFLTNAIRYNRENGQIRVKTGIENGMAFVTVADTGVGISAADLPRVFERFYRADRSRSTGGTGLGLAISKAIVESHGGTINVSSEAGKGSTFTVRLPLQA